MTPLPKLLREDARPSFWQEPHGATTNQPLVSRLAQTGEKASATASLENYVFAHIMMLLFSHIVRWVYSITPTLRSWYHKRRFFCDKIWACDAEAFRKGSYLLDCRGQVRDGHGFQLVLLPPIKQESPNAHAAVTETQRPEKRLEKKLLRFCLPQASSLVGKISYNLSMRIK